LHQVGDLFVLIVKLRCQKVKMDLKETGWERLQWIYVVEGRDR
jgi:hypothetical protein